MPTEGFLAILSRTTQLGVIGNLSEGALNPTVHVANKDTKQLNVFETGPFTTLLPLYYR